MRVRIVAAGAAMFAGLITNTGLGTPAFAICLPLWGSVCRPAASPSTETATADEAKPNKPLNLGAVAHKGGKRIHVAARHRQPTAAKQASRNALAARSRIAAARRLASAKHRPIIAVRRPDGTKEAIKTPPAAFREQAAQVAAAVAASASNATTSGTANPPASQTDGYIPSQNEVTALDLAADQPKAPPPAAEAPNPALWNAVMPTDPAANSGVDPSSDDAKIAPANDQVASADTANTTNTAEVTAPPQQQPSEEPSWLRRIMIGLGGVLTLASAVRLFAG